MDADTILVIVGLVFIGLVALYAACEDRYGDWII